MEAASLWIMYLRKIAEEPHMTRKAQPPLKVWLVDDLKSNLGAFVSKHSSEDFLIEPFEEPEHVSNRLAAREYPDALLIDVFFYPDKTERYPTNTPEEVERLVTAQVQELRGKWFADEHYARGIGLMEEIHEKVLKGELPSFPMFAYTTKAPYLLERHAWQRIHRTDAKVLLKNILEPGDERRFIRDEVAKYKQTWWRRIAKDIREAMRPINLSRLIANHLINAVFGVVGLVAGYLLKWWLTPCN
jgi:hypothetical protein